MNFLNLVLYNFFKFKNREKIKMFGVVIKASLVGLALLGVYSFIEFDKA